MNSLFIFYFFVCFIYSLWPFLLFLFIRLHLATLFQFAPLSLRRILFFSVARQARNGAIFHMITKFS